MYIYYVIYISYIYNFIILLSNVYKNIRNKDLFLYIQMIRNYYTCKIQLCNISFIQRYKHNITQVDFKGLINNYW